MGAHVWQLEGMTQPVAKGLIAWTLNFDPLSLHGN